MRLATCDALYEAQAPTTPACKALACCSARHCPAAPNQEHATWRRFAYPLPYKWSTSLARTLSGRRACTPYVFTANADINLVMWHTHTKATWRNVGANHPNIGTVIGVQKAGGGRLRDDLSRANISNISWAAWQQWQGSVDVPWASPTRKSMRIEWSTRRSMSLLRIAASVRFRQPMSVLRLLRRASSVQQ